MKIYPHSRRAFLRGAAGAALAVPFLPSLLGARAEAQAAAGPTRFVFMGAVFGRDVRYWYPSQDPTQVSSDGGAYYSKLSELSGPISYILNTPFDGLRNKISLLRGLDNMQPGDAHGPTVPLTASGAMPSGVGFGYSLDAVLEESRKFYATRPMASAIRTCPSGQWDQLSFSYSSASAPKQSLWHEWDPRVVYNKYFNPTTVAKSAQQAVYKRSVVDSVMDDYRRVASSSAVGSEDKRRLDHYLSLLVEAEARLGVAPVSCTRGTDPGAPADYDKIHSAAIDLEVAALACGITRVVCHNIIQFSAQADGYDAHTEAHLHSPSREDPSVSQHAVHNRWVMGKVAEFLQKLDAVQDGSGTLLDDTVFLYGNADGHGFHAQYDMPVLVAGGGGRLKTGYYIDYRPRPFNMFEKVNKLIAGRPYNNLLISLFQAFGLGASDYNRLQQPGFGIYDQFPSSLRAHYAPFLAGVDQPLPFLTT